jgi:hypothetical protein
MTSSARRFCCPPWPDEIVASFGELDWGGITGGAFAAYSAASGMPSASAAPKRRLS